MTAADLPASRQLGVLGLSFKSAPVEVRERLAVSASSVPAVLNQLRSAGAEEAVVLSTCNRVELYWTARSGASVAETLLNAWNQQTAGDAGHLSYTYYGAAAAVHLFRVAAGLDSMVLGEPQILGQVKTAYLAALEAHGTGAVLNRLFQRAMQAGKKVRTDTDIASGISSVASAAVVLAGRIFKNLADCRVMILGAGKMAESAARHLISHKTHSLTVANRTYERAKELADSLGAQALSWEAGMAQIPQTDIVICSTSCTQFILRADAVERWMRERRGRPLFLIDIAVPRNVEPLVNRLDNVYLYDIDDLRSVVAEQTVHKQAEAERAEQMVRDLAMETLEMLRPRREAPPLEWSKDYA